jgi:uncharacterized protein (TIGR03435 family)
VIRTIAAAVLALIPAYEIVAQSTAAPLPRFELASVKPAVPSRTVYPWDATRKLGFSAASGKVDLRYISLMDLLTLTFGVEPYQVNGPSWLGTQFFDISTIAPAGTQKEQILLMLQDLLSDRFHMRSHQETLMAPIYALVVAPGGPKLRPGVPDDESDRVGPIGGSTKTDGPKGPVTTTSARTFFGIYKLTVANGVAHYEFPNISMTGLALFLTPRGGHAALDLPVVDMTDLNDHYQVSLDMLLAEMHSRGVRIRPADPGNADSTVPEASDPTESAIPASLAKQGIKLVRRSVPLQKIVIDDIERRATAN